MKNKIRQVFKIQIALFGHGALIYNEDKSIMFETVDDDEILELRTFINNQPKAYAIGYVNKNGKIVFEEVLNGTNLF